MQELLAEVQEARRLTVLVFQNSAEMGLRVGEACIMARRYLEHRGYMAPDDPLAFATGGRVTMRDGDLGARLVIRSSGETI